MVPQERRRRKQKKTAATHTVEAIVRGNAAKKKKATRKIWPTATWTQSLSLARSEFDSSRRTDKIRHDTAQKRANTKAPRTQRRVDETIKKGDETRFTMDSWLDEKNHGWQGLLLLLLLDTLDR